MFPFSSSSALLDDLDKELNNYIMRCREWYGWHFPELGKVITDNLAYCKTVRKIGNSDHHRNLSALVVNFSPLRRLAGDSLKQIQVFVSQAIAQTLPAPISPTSSQKKSRPRLNWLLRSPWEQRCRNRTSTTSCTCVIRYVCFYPPSHIRHSFPSPKA